jgi:hypothetical protein
MFPSPSRAALRAATARAAPLRSVAVTSASGRSRAIAAAMALGAVAIVGASFRGALRGWRGEVNQLDLLATFRRLAIAQTIGFAILEVVERKAAGVTLSGLAGVFPRGLLVQVAIAALAALVLWLLDRSAASIASAIRERARFARVVSVVSPKTSACVASPTLVAFDAISLRGPPLRSRI